jgi:hypothetical protein
MQIRTLALRELNLDPRNPRLGLRNSEAELPQDAILEMMEDWALEELAISFLESGYWPQEALLVVREPIYGAEGNIVVEGNRRLAALILLYRAFHGRAAGRKWAELVEGRSEPVGLFENIELQPCRERRECQRPSDYGVLGRWLPCLKINQWVRRSNGRQLQLQSRFDIARGRLRHRPCESCCPTAPVPAYLSRLRGGRHELNS